MMEKLVCVCFICFMTGMAVQSVGQVYSCTPAEWWFPIQMFGLLAAPAAFAYMAGRKDSSPTSLPLRCSKKS